MKKSLLVALTLITVLLSACNKRAKEIEEIEAMAVKMDSVAKANPVFTVAHKVEAEALIAEYLEFVRSYPKDTLSPVYLMQASRLFAKMPDVKEELELLDRLIAEYPESPMVPQALITAANESELILRDFDRAKGYYQTLMDKFPESPYSKNLDLQIEYMGDPDGLYTAIMQRAGKPIDGEVIDSVDAVK